MVPNLTRIQSTQFLKLSLPLVLEVTFVILVSNIVVWMLANYSDQVAAGVAIAGQVNNTIFLFFAIVSMGAGILMAQSSGQKNQKKMQSIFSHALFFALIFGLIGTLVFFVFYHDIFSFYQLESSVQGYAEEYGLLLAPFFILNAIFLVFNQTLYANGKTLQAFYSLFLCDVTILLGSAIFIFGVPWLHIPSLGVFGAALGIILGRMVYLVSLGFFIYRHLRLKFTLPKKNPFKQSITKLMFKVGAPATLENLSYALFMMLITRLIASYGTEAIIAKAYFDSLAMFTFFIASALANSGAIRVGQLLGEENYVEAQSTIRYSVKLAFVSSVIPSVVLAIGMGFISTWYTNDPLVIEYLIYIAMADVLLEIGRVFNLVVNRAIKASGDVRYPLVSIIVIQWFIILPISLFFGDFLRLGVIGIWIALAIDEALRGLNLWLRWRGLRWQRKAKKLFTSMAAHHDEN
jgi:putative MATE family efflux protein